MIIPLVKIIVGGVAVYSVAKVLERTQILEKVIAAGTERVDQVLSQINKAYETQATNVNGGANR